MYMNTVGCVQAMLLAVVGSKIGAPERRGRYMYTPWCHVTVIGVRHGANVTIPTSLV
jgi:hypothetical protein